MGEKRAQVAQQGRGLVDGAGPTLSGRDAVHVGGGIRRTTLCGPATLQARTLRVLGAGVAQDDIFACGPEAANWANVWPFVLVCDFIGQIDEAASTQKQNNPPFCYSAD